MLSSIFITLCLSLIAAKALPVEPSTGYNGSWPAGVKRDLPIFEIDYDDYPQSAENICYSWYCNNGPRAVTPNRPAANQNRASNSCGNVDPNRCSTRVGHDAGYQCDEWPWANSNAGGANAVTRCILTRDNTGSGASWGNFINNQGPQAPGFVLQDNVDFAEIRVTNVPFLEENIAHFCLGERGVHITPGACDVLDHGQPYLQQIG
ncbi:endo-exonuclease [Desarmillaria tabescens]|uniref:Endo-exonuclease n=1 Tax=Armillaria tabescens TaxID=1929756 RepID=A0AA39MM95_ARMTA|nr:endo-exonuclease [Desarmillaria tabescens]KAK0439517.1 endo-exonuclease [Desarmillaria tabescens]